MFKRDPHRFPSGYYWLMLNPNIRSRMVPFKVLDSLILTGTSGSRGIKIGQGKNSLMTGSRKMSASSVNYSKGKDVIDI